MQKRACAIQLCINLLLSLSFLTVQVSPAPDPPTPTSPTPVLNPAVTNCTVCLFLKQPQNPYGIFSGLLDQANLYEKLATNLKQGPLTIFAPRDGYLTRHVNADILTFLKAPGNEDILQRVLLFHVIHLDAGVDRLTTGTYPTLSNDWLTAVKLPNGRIRLENGSPVKLLNHFNASGGFISGIDGLLLPSAAEDILCRQQLWLNCSPVAPGPAPAPGATDLPAGLALDALKATGQFSKFLSAMAANNVDTVVRSWKGPVTILAPPDIAFEMAAPNITEILSDVRGNGALAIIMQHIVPSYVTLQNYVNRPPTVLPTLNNGNITATSTAHFVMFNGVNVQSQIADIMGPTNASVMGITQLLVPAVMPVPEKETEGAELLAVMAQQGRYSKFIAALSYSGLKNLLSAYNGPLTILAPVDESFVLTFTFEQQRLQAILLYHLLPSYFRLEMLRSIAPGNITTLEGRQMSITERPDGSLEFNGNGSVTVDVPVPFDDGQGAIIEVRGLIVPDADSLGVGRPSRSSQISDALTLAGNYSTLLNLMELSTHKSLLVNPSSPITLFAFSDVAMINLVNAQGMNGTFSKQKYYQNGLEQLISYHIVEGYFTRQLMQGVAPYNLSTWSGDDIMLTKSNMSANPALILDGRARIDRPDILVNDLISVQGIDRVLVPLNLFRDGDPRGAENSSTTAPLKTPTANKDSGRAHVRVVVGIVASFGCLGLLSCCCCCLCLTLRRRREHRKMLSQPKFTVGPNPLYSDKVDGEYFSDEEAPRR